MVATEVGGRITEGSLPKCYRVRVENVMQGYCFSGSHVLDLPVFKLTLNLQKNVFCNASEARDCHYWQ